MLSLITKSWQERLTILISSKFLPSSLTCDGRTQQVGFLNLRRFNEFIVLVKGRKQFQSIRITSS